jgi:uncharacterized membrane protein YeaQ/YmgE (transglycosylase-associated protein family)
MKVFSLFYSSAWWRVGWPERSCAAPALASFGDILVGIAGAFISSLLFPRLGFHLGSGLVSEIIYSAIGAIVLLLVVRLLRGGGRF